MAGFDNDTMYADNVDFSGSATPSPQVLLDGQLLIGSTATPHIKVNTLTAGAGITITNGSGAITIAATGGVTPVGGLVPDAHTAPGTTPVVGDGSGNITVTGAQVASGVVGTNVIRTDSLAANTMTIEIQRSTTAAASTPADNGVSHYDSSIFTVGAGGFVSLVGGAVPPSQKFDVDAHTAPGTDPVVPTALGVVSITGAQVAAGVVGTNVIRTDSLVANTYTIEVQRTATAAAPTLASNGVSHFDNTIFTADGSGFVSLVGGAVPPTQKFNVDTNTPPGTDPVVPTALGVVNITGAQVATGTIGTNVIRTNSTAANTITVEVQRSTAVAGSDVTKNGVCHFNSADFTVDTNGFVSSIAGGGGGSWQFIETKNAPVVATLTFNTSLSNFTELMFTWNGLAVAPTSSLLFSASANNGVSTISGMTGLLSSGYGPGSSTSFYNAASQSATGFYGYVTIQNTPGTLPRMSFGESFGGSGTRVFSVIGTSAVINWVQFSVSGGVLNGDINVFGR